MSNVHHTDYKANVEQLKQLIEPFKSTTQKKPVPKFNRVFSGSIEKRLDDMGYTHEEVTTDSEKRGEMEHRLQWDIAHQEYEVLKPCIAITGHWGANNIPYTIDLYGDGSHTHNGALYVPPDEALLRYQPLGVRRRQDAILSRIAITNIKLIVPNVQIKNVEIDGRDVRAEYNIII